MGTNYLPPGNLAGFLTRPHSALTNLEGDQHPRHAFLDGRSGGQVFYGCVGSAENFDLDTVSGDFKATNTGRLRFLERVVFFPNSVTLDSTPAANRTMVRVPNTTGFTISANLSPTMFAFEPAIFYNVDAQAGARVFYAGETITITASQSDFHGIGAVHNNVTITLSGVACFLDPIGAFADAPTLTRTGSGTFNDPNLSSWTSFESLIVCQSLAANDLHGVVGYKFDTSQLGSACQSEIGFHAFFGHALGTATAFNVHGGATGGDQQALVSDIASGGTNLLNRFCVNSGGAPSWDNGNHVRYNGDDTAGNGLVSIVGNEVLTQQSWGTGSGQSGVRSLFVTNRAGLYGFRAYMVVTSAGNSAASIFPRFFWVDDQGSQSFIPAAGMAMTTLGTFLANFATGQYPLTFRAASGTLISYSTSATNPVSAGRYLIHVAVERLA